MKKIYYLFLFLVILMSLLGILETKSFYNTKEKIRNDVFNELLKNVETTSKNIATYINENYELENIKKSPKIKEKIDSYLSSFIGNNYKNLFIVYPYNEKFFVALADGSKKDKFDFKERFQPLAKKEWQKLRNEKQPIYFKQNIKDIWVTYLYPVNNKDLKYIIVIDFSTKPLLLINRSLDNLKSNVVLFSVILIISILILIGFFIYDYKRQDKMQRLVEELKNLNDSLEERVKEEVEKNRQKDKRLIDQARLALMGELLSMVAHQWRQPLNSIGGIVSNLKLDIALGEVDDTKLDKTLHKIERIILHLSHTIDDFRRFYRQYDEKDLTTIKISKIIKETLSIISYSLTNNKIKLKLHIKDDVEIKIIPNRLKQVILNIIKNGIDALIENRVQNPYIQIDVTYDSILKIEISDNAGGIPEDIKDKIFDPYFTTKNEKNGTGIGLYMSKMIIEKLNGDIIVSNSDKGAVFLIELKGEDGN